MASDKVLSLSELAESAHVAIVKAFDSHSLDVAESLYRQGFVDGLACACAFTLSVEDISKILKGVKVNE